MVLRMGMLQKSDGGGVETATAGGRVALGLRNGVWLRSGLNRSQVGPDAVTVIGAQITPRDSTATSQLDGQAMLKRNASVLPIADGRWLDTQGRSQSSPAIHVTASPVDRVLLRGLFFGVC